MISESENIQRHHIVSVEMPGTKTENNYRQVPSPEVEPEDEKGPMVVRQLVLVAQYNDILGIFGIL